jgi:hypothetical protein
LAANQVIGNATRADWLTYVRGADAVIGGTSPYAPFQTEGPFVLTAAAEGLGYVYPPSAAVLMAPILRPFELWSALSLTIFLCGLLAVLWRQEMLKPLPALLALLFAVVSPPLWDGLSSGAVSVVLAGMLGLAYAGVPAAGLGAAVKLFPASWIALDYSRRAILWGVAGVAVPVAASIALAGISPWLDYAAVLRNMSPDCERFLPSGVCLGVPVWAVYAAGALIVLAATRGPRPWLLLALGVLPIVLGPQVSLHYLCTAIPGVIAVMARWGDLLSRKKPTASTVAPLEHGDRCNH